MTDDVRTPSAGPSEAESRRLEVLDRLAIMDTPPEPALDRLAHQARRALRTRSATVTLLDADRQWFKARAGVEACGTPRSASLCQHAIGRLDGLTVILDALNDPRYADLAVVAGPPFIRFYAAAPLIVEGAAVGTLCVFDPAPRDSMSEEEQETLRDLAVPAAELIRLRLDAAERRALARFRETQTRQLTLAEKIAGVGHWSLSHDGSISWSDQVYRIHGVNREEFNPNLDDALQFYPDQEDRERVSAYIERARTTGEGFSFRAPLTRRSDGARRVVRAQGESHPADEDGPAKLFGVFCDVTEEEALMDDLRQARDVAEAAARSKTEFLANMSHELRSPLNAILGYSDLLETQPGLDASSQQFVSRISTAGRTLLHLVDDVLDYSRIQSQGVQLCSDPFDPVRLAENASELVRPTAEEKALPIKLTVDAEGVTVLGDALRLNQVLLNLLTNAVKFTASGEVRLHVETRARPGRRARISFAVHDTGIGIPQDRLEAIFGRFEQADASTRRRYGGTGLGLAISRSLVEAMGGRLEARSKPGEGSTFSFVLDLPIAGALAPSAAAPAPGDVDQMHGLRVLLADDVHINRELIQLLLRSSGVEITMACDGAEAVRAAEAQPFDLILMDVQMPGVDGLEASRRIRAGGGPNSTSPIVALTANVLEEEVERCRASGMNDHVSKPIDSVRLRAAILRNVGARSPGTCSSRTRRVG